MGEHGDAVEQIGGLVRRGILVLQAKAFRGHHDVIDLVTTGIQRPAHAALIQRQADIFHPVLTRHALHHSIAVGHRRNQFWVDKARRLHAPHHVL